MVCDRNFFGCFTPGGSFQSLSYDVTASYDVIIYCDVRCIFAVTSSFVLLPGVKSSRKNFAYTKFHVVPREGTLAYFCDVITQTFEASVGGEAAEKNFCHIGYHFVIW